MPRMRKPDVAVVAVSVAARGRSARRGAATPRIPARPGEPTGQEPSRDDVQREEGAHRATVADGDRALPLDDARDVDDRLQAAQLDGERLCRDTDRRPFEAHDTEVEGELEVELHPRGPVADPR